MVFERISEAEDIDNEPVQSIPLPEGGQASLGPNQFDAYQVFNDLCSLTEGSLFGPGRMKPEAQQILHIPNITPTFGLELIESILSGYADGFRKVR
jgi:hypothetical protein